MLSQEQVQTRVWAFIAIALTLILLVSVIAIIYGVMFVEHNLEKISPIDQAFLGILKDIMLLCIGAIGGIVGAKGAQTIAESTAKPCDDKKED